MPREYRHIKMYEKEIFELREQGLSQRQIAEKLGFPYEKMHDFLGDITEINVNLQQEKQSNRRVDREKTELNCRRRYSN